MAKLQHSQGGSKKPKGSRKAIKDDKGTKKVFGGASPPQAAATHGANPLKRRLLSEAEEEDPESIILNLPDEEEDPELYKSKKGQVPMLKR
jgi:hypothetical protein